MPDVVTGGMAAVSLYSAHQGAEAADDANSMQDAELQMAMERDRFNKEQIEQNNEWTTEDREDFIGRRDRERDLLDPVQEGIVDRANAGPDIEGAMKRSDADVSQSYGLARETNRRNNQRYGVNPSSGRQSSESRKLGNAEALTRTFGRNKARLQEDDRDWARKIAAIGTGNIRNASPNAQLGQLGVSGAEGVLGRQAGSNAIDANASYGLAGKLGADAIDRYDNRGSTPATNPISASNTVHEQNNWD
jgi:hypothetical protein